MTTVKLTKGDGELTFSLRENFEVKYEKIGGRIKDTITIPTKPASNILTFDITSKNITFHWQGPLNEDENCKQGKNCTANYCDCLAPFFTAHRPVEVVGSYAIMFKNNEGKFGHMYRPFAEDADGKKVWCIQELKDNKITVKVPQSFIDNAKYPVIIDPIVGMDSVGGSHGNSEDDHDVAYGPYAAEASGNITWIKFYATSTASGEVTLGIFSDNGSDYPNANLEDGGGVTMSSDGWQEDTLDATQAVTNGTKYWLCLNKDEDVNDYWDSVAGYYIKWKVATYSSGTLPSTWPSSGYSASSRKFSIYSDISGATGTNTQINIGDVWKAIAGMQINIGDDWKAVAGAQVNIGDTWKEIF